MQIIGYVILGGLAFAGFLLAEWMFLSLKGRAFWRAMVPPNLRYQLYPQDDVRMDPWMFLEEWAAFLFYGACLTLPAIALEVMGLVALFR